MAERNKRLLAAKIASIKDVDTNLKIEAPISEESKEDYDTIEVEFTTEEYDNIQETIKLAAVQSDKIEMLVDRVEDYKNEIQYLRESLNKRNDQMDKMLESINSSLASIQQQNFIQAKEKGFDKK
jgi:recombination DNA repair RAD52 pathway protein